MTGQVSTKKESRHLEVKEASVAPQKNRDIFARSFNLSTAAGT